MHNIQSSKTAVLQFRIQALFVFIFFVTIDNIGQNFTVAIGLHSRILICYQIQCTCTFWYDTCLYELWKTTFKLELFFFFFSFLWLNSAKRNKKKNWRPLCTIVKHSHALPNYSYFFSTNVKTINTYVKLIHQVLHRIFIYRIFILHSSFIWSANSAHCTLYSSVFFYLCPFFHSHTSWYTDTFVFFTTVAWCSPSL